MNAQAGRGDEPQECSQLSLACPECGGRAVVAIENLDRRLYCRCCRQWCRVERGGLTAISTPAIVALHEVSVRTGLSEWMREHVPAKSMLSRRRPLGRLLRPAYWWPRVLQRARPIGISLALLVGLVVTLGVSRWSASAAQPPEQLPPSLDARAPLLSQAWLDQDVSRMLRLTESSRDRELRRWLAGNPAPAGPGDRGDARPTVQLASTQMHDAGKAEVIVRIEVPKATGLPTTILQRQWWCCRAGTWYFLPNVATWHPRRS
ncbi:MAG: hypothetical protein ABSG68_25125 [Thermoguttaceae bacterium]|jgi:hypothetical protein